MERLNAFHYAPYKGFEIWNDEGDGLYYAEDERYNEDGLPNACVGYTLQEVRASIDEILLTL